MEKIIFFFREEKNLGYATSNISPPLKTASKKLSLEKKKCMY